MRGPRKAAGALRGDERGLTLIELLVAATLGLIVVGGAMSIFLSSVSSEPRTASKVGAIQQGRVAIDRITRELRQGLEVPATPASSNTELRILTYVKAVSCGGAPASTSIPCRVTYACSDDGTCSRTVAQPDGIGAGTPTQVMSGLSSPIVFSYTPSPADAAYVGVTFSIATDGAPVTLSDGVALRNPEEDA